MRVAIIGAGPAGLSCADKLKNLDKNIQIDIFEKSNYIGGISKTINYKNNRIDIGGHRFFSKSDEVMKWWANKFPIDPNSLSEDKLITYRKSSRNIDGFKVANQKEIDSGRVLLLRKRKSRILYQRKLYDYPLRLNKNTIKNIGITRMIEIGFSYLLSKFNTKEPSNLEECIKGKFGVKLYQMFFESYTYKVWGRTPKQISADWGAQRIKGLSIRKVLIDIIKKYFSRLNKSQNSIDQKGTETSLIERFLYPKYGPGHMWEEVANDLISDGVSITKEAEVTEIFLEDEVNKVKSIKIKINGKYKINSYDYIISTMPISELMRSISGKNKIKIFQNSTQEIAYNLPYRDFITVGLLLNNIHTPNGDDLDDTWIYVQESDVKVGRLQIFNNWSPYLVADKDKKWIGLEFFCQEGDEIWNLKDAELIALGQNELRKLMLCEKSDFVDGTVIREKKTYPAYFDSYMNFDILKHKFDEIENLFLIGRNGMHKYNNQDHSMLTGFRAAELICKGKTSKKDKNMLWEINAEKDYHEIKKN